MRADAHELRNLPLGRKLIETAGLVGLTAVFVLTWALSLRSVREGYTSEAIFYFFGNVLTDLKQESPRMFLVLCAGNLGSMGALFLMSRRLFRRTALRSRVRFALSLLCSGLTLLCGLLWATLRFGSLTNTLMGPASALGALVLLLCAAVPLKQMWIYHRVRPSAPRRDQPPGSVAPPATGARPRRVVLVGGGFAGLYAALELDRLVGHDRSLEIVVIDRNNYFLFPPLLPSAAAGTIETRQVTFPFRRIFETTNIAFRRATVERIDPDRRVIDAIVDREGVARGVEIEYDYLLLCPGSVTNTFRTPGAAEHALFMRELGDAIAARDQIIDCFERAAATPEENLRAQLLRFVIVGAGPTGLELATEIHDLVYDVLLKRYPEIDRRLVDIVLVQSGGQILPGWDERIVRTAAAHLATLRVRLVLDARVSAVSRDHVALQDGTMLRTRTCLWCAGVRPAPLLERAGLPLHASGRVPVGADLRVLGRDDVFVLGDAAYLVDERTGRPLPPLGQVAFQQGPRAARNVVALLEGRAPSPFRYFDFGALVSVGEHYAAVNLLGVRLSGFLGWFVWRTLYLAKMVGLSNKLRILLDWTLDLLIERSFTQLRGDVRPTAPRS